MLHERVAAGGVRFALKGGAAKGCAKTGHFRHFSLLVGGLTLVHPMRKPVGGAQSNHVTDNPSSRRAAPCDGREGSKHVRGVFFEEKYFFPANRVALQESSDRERGKLCEVFSERIVFTASAEASPYVNAPRMHP